MSTTQEQESPKMTAVDVIRENSRAARLTSLSELRAGQAEDPLPEIESSGAEDIQSLEGASEVYYFSKLHMTRSYAGYLCRVEEKDLVRLMAETVREDSRLYPRPTPLEFFQNPPFGLTPEIIDDILVKMREREDCEDIRENAASNGARYLYSTRHLSPPLADSLTEWTEVGQAENP